MFDYLITMYHVCVLSLLLLLEVFFPQISLQFLSHSEAWKILLTRFIHGAFVNRILLVEYTAPFKCNRLTK